jgi:outer membrane lipoprotein SlyB
MKTQINVVQKNMIGALAGAAALYLIAKKSGNVTNVAVIAALVLGGALVGSNIQNAFKNQPKSI